jgi:ribose transport system substrate-binding protein
MQGQLDAIGERVAIPAGSIVELDSGNVHDQAYRQTLQALAAIPIGTRLAVISINDPTMRGAIAALRQTGHVAYAVAVSEGADRLALGELERPDTPLVGAVVFSPESYGERLIPLALDILAGREVPPAVYQQHRLVRPHRAATTAGQHGVDGLPHERMDYLTTAEMERGVEDGRSASVPA